MDVSTYIVSIAVACKLPEMDVAACKRKHAIGTAAKYMSNSEKARIEGRE